MKLERLAAFSTLSLSFVAAVIMVAGWPLAPDNDLYFHLASGRRIAQIHGPMLHDVFTYTALGQPDEAWHSWVSQAVFHALYSRFGFLGLQVLNTLLIWVTLGFAAHFVWRRTGQAALAGVAAALVLLVHHHVQILRPLLFGEMLFSILVFGILGEGKALTRAKLLISLLLSVAWANFHGSAVIVPPLFFLYAVGVWWDHRASRNIGLSLASPLLVFLATCINPRGAGLYSYAWELTQMGKRAGNLEWGGAKPLELTQGLAEPLRLTLHLDIPSLALVVGLIFFLHFMLHRHQSPNRPSYATILLLGFLCLLPLISMRHTTYLVFSAAFLVCLFGERSRTRLERFPRFTVTACALLSIILLTSFRFYRSFDVCPSIEKASNFIDDAQLSGNLFTDPAWSSYLIFRHYPAVKTARDTRTLLHRTFYEEVSRLYGRYGMEAWSILLRNLSEETDLALISSLRSEAALNPREWMVIFENNHTTLALRKNHKNAENLRRVSAYYQRQGVPFDGARGYQIREVVEAAPAWFNKHREKMPWGRWPEPAAVQSWKLKQKGFYESRKIAEISPFG